MIDPRALVYGGRVRPLPDLPNVTVLSEWEALPGDLLPLLASATALVVMDPESFPFESLRDPDRDLPMAVALPGDDAVAVEALLGTPCLDHLGPWDAIGASDALWGGLTERRHWPSTLRAGPGPGAAVLASRLMGITRGAKHRWRRLIRGVRAEIRRFDRAPRVLDLGATVSGWMGDASSLVVVSDDVEERMAAAVPGARTLRWDGSRLDLDDGAVDIVVAPALVVPDRPGTVPVAEWWRVLAAGGSIVVEIEADPALAGSGPLRVRDAVVEASGGTARLTGADAIRLPGDEYHRFAVATFRDAA